MKSNQIPNKRDISKENNSDQNSDQHSHDTTPNKFDMEPGDGIFFSDEVELEKYLKSCEPNRKLVN